MPCRICKTKGHNARTHRRYLYHLRKSIKYGLMVHTSHVDCNGDNIHNHTILDTIIDINKNGTITSHENHDTNDSTNNESNDESNEIKSDKEMIDEFTTEFNREEESLVKDLPYGVVFFIILTLIKYLVILKQIT